VHTARKLIICNAGLYAATGVSMVFLAVLLAARGLDAAQVGLVIGLSYLVRVAAAPLWGQLADALGRIRLVMAVSCTLAAGAVLLLLSVRGFWPVTALVLLASTGSSAAMPLSDTVVWRSAERDGFTFGQVRAAGSGAFVLGVLGSGFVVESTGSTSIAWMIALCYLLSVVLLPTISPVNAAPRRREPMLRPLLAIPEYRRVLAFSALIQGAHAAYYSLSTLHWRIAGISDRTIGLLWSEGVVAEILAMILLRHRLGRIDPSLLILVGVVGSILRWIGTALTTDPLWLAWLQPLHAASFALPYLAALRIIGDRTPLHLSATAQSVYAAIGVCAPTGLLMALTSRLYPSWSGGVFFLMAGLALAALPLVWPRQRQAATLYPPAPR
jgi:PPP family 3-phenylpropionic acid transporter